MLLLPLESAFMHEKITPDFVKDHIVLSDGLSHKGAQIVTLSGLHSTLDGYITPTILLFLQLSSSQQEPHVSFDDQPNLITIPRYPQSNNQNFCITTIAHSSTWYITHFIPSIRSAILFAIYPSTTLYTNLIKTPASSKTFQLPSYFNDLNNILANKPTLFGSSHIKPSAPVPTSPPASLHSFDSS